MIHNKAIRLDEESLEKVFDYLDSVSDSEVNDSSETRYSYRSKGCQIEIQQPGDTSWKLFLSPTRDLSQKGISFLHGNYVHTGSNVKINLITTHGNWVKVKGVVVRCRFIKGSVHEVKVRFDNNIEITDFCEKARVSKVLIVEDDDFTARLNEHHLSNLNCDVTVVSSGEEAIDAINNNEFDLVLMDMILPGISGFESTQQLIVGGYQGKIVALTSLTQENDKNDCIDSGCHEYYSKPIKKEDLKKIIESIKAEPIISDYHDDKNMIDLINEFVTLMPEKVNEIREAFNKNDLIKLKKISIDLFESAGSYGFTPITESTNELIGNINNFTDINEIRKKVNELCKICTLVRPVSN